MDEEQRDAADAPPERPSALARVRRALPVVITAAVLTYLFFRVPFRDVIESTRHAKPWLVPVGLALLGAILGADAYATYKTFGWCVRGIGLRQMFVLRAASYLLASINHTVGQGALLVFVRRATGISAAEATAATLLVAGSNAFVLLLMATLGFAAISTPVPYPFGVLVAAYAGAVVYGAVVAMRPAWFTRISVFRALADAKLSGHVKATLVRIPHVLGLMAYNYAMMRGFGIDLPLSVAALGLPVVYIIAFLPISFQGLGTAQAVMVVLFAPYAEGSRVAQEAAVLGSSMVAVALLLVFQVAVGLLALRTTTGQAIRSSLQPTTAPREPP